MALSIKSAEADRLARELARVTGESLTVAVLMALKERLDRRRGRSTGRPLGDQIMEIGRRCARLPILDDRSPEAILGYDDSGVAR